MSRSWDLVADSGVMSEAVASSTLTPPNPGNITSKKPGVGSHLWPVAFPVRGVVSQWPFPVGTAGTRVRERVAESLSAIHLGLVEIWVGWRRP